MNIIGVAIATPRHTSCVPLIWRTCGIILQLNVAFWVSSCDHLGVMHYIGRTQGSNPEVLMFMSLLEACQERGIKDLDTWRTLRFPYQT